MKEVSEIAGIAITLHVDGRQVLLVMVHRDGAVNRIGDGSVDGGDKDMFIGRVSPSLLPAVTAGLTKETLRHTDTHELGNKKGVSCRLSIILWFSDETREDFVFDYGSASEGPPKEVTDFVRHAVTVTEPWYQLQRAMVASTSPGTRTRPWWRFWR